MATFITTIKFTEQGIANVKDTCKRAKSFRADAKKMGVKVKEIYWTIGAHDGLLIFDAPEEETATAAILHLASLGNVHTETRRAYATSEMESIIGKLPS